MDGLSPAAIFQILNKSEKQVTRPSRRSTLSALADVIGAEVQIECSGNQFALVQKYDLPETDSNELSLLLSEIGDWIISRKKRVTEEERVRIVRVVKTPVTTQKKTLPIPCNRSRKTSSSRHEHE